MATNQQQRKPELYQDTGGSVVILGPMQGSMRSYHASGLSPKEEYLEMKRRAKAHIECVQREFRL